MTQLLLISFLISIKGYQCNSSASSENHVSTYKSVFKIIPPGAEENVENVELRSIGNGQNVNEAFDRNGNPL